MKIQSITAILFFTFNTVKAQNIYHPAVSMPESGLEKMVSDNPYVVQQVKDSSGGWVNAWKSFWLPAEVSGYKKSESTYGWENNAWVERSATNDSIILNNEGLIVTIIQKSSYNYPGYEGKEKLRFTYTYNPDKSLNTIRSDQATSINSNVYNPGYYLKVYYDENNRRIKDSFYYYQSQYMALNHYVYNANNQIIANHGVNAGTGDTVSHTYFSYDNDLIKSLYSEYFDQTSDDWVVQNADSIIYTNQKISNRIRYGLFIDNGVASVRPYANETYEYNANGLSLIYSKSWDGNGWVNASKTDIIYKPDGSPALGLFYVVDANGDYSTVPESQYLFDFLASSPEINKQAQVAGVYPNPAQNVLNIHNYGGAYEVFNMNGQLIASGILHDKEEALNLETYTNGIYYLRVNNNEQTQTLRFMVLK